MKILNRLPVITTDTLAYVGDEAVRFRDAQIIVWMSITSRKTTELSPTTPRFPVILDTGHSRHFAIQEQHLVRWSGLRANSLPILGNIQNRDVEVTVLGANLWIYLNEPGRSTFTTKSFKLDSMQGVEVFPDRNNHPRLPLLGLRAILSNHLQLTVDSKTKTVSLSTPDWRDRIVRWFR